SRWRVAAGVVGLVAGTLAALSPLAFAGASQTRYVIGAKNFSEQYILAELISDRLKVTGAATALKEDLGSTIAYSALKAGEVDVYVDYSGTLWANILKRTDNPGRQAVLGQLTTQLKARDGVVVLGSLGFENAYALAMRRAEAERLGVRTLDDLAAHAPQLTLGADLEFLSRPEWASVRDAYGLKFGKQTQFQPTFMYRALTSGQADVISAFSSDGRIAADNLRVLHDPLHVIPPYDAIVLIAPARANDPVLRKALEPLLGAIPIELMRQANYSVDRDTDKKSPVQAAQWLSSAAHIR